MYRRPPRNKRPAIFDDPTWVEVFERGKCPRPDLAPIGADSHPAADVYDLVFQRNLSDLRWRVEQLCMALSKPNVGPVAPGSSCSNLSRGQLLSEFSEIWDFLTKPCYQDGSPRLPGKVSLACSSGGLQVTLTDQTSNCYCCVTTASLDDAFLALEMALKDGSIAWRPSTFSKQKK
jgi:hypothetical protein